MLCGTKTKSINSSQDFKPAFMSLGNSPVRQAFLPEPRRGIFQKHQVAAGVFKGENLFRINEIRIREEQ
jgi:hypothetical protein